MASTSTKRSAPGSSPRSDSRSPKKPRYESGLVDLGLSPDRVEELDKQVLRFAGASEPHPAVLLFLVVATAKDVECLDMKFTNVTNCEELLKDNDGLVDQSKQAWTQHKFTPIRSLSMFSFHLLHRPFTFLQRCSNQPQQDPPLNSFRAPHARRYQKKDK